MLDCLVIGAGPAGLTAGVYFARYRRDVLLVDGGDSRASWIPRTRNLPGYPDGINGNELLDHLRAHAGRYDVRVERGTVDALRRIGDGFEADLGGRAVQARTVLLATGCRDVVPDLPGVAEGLAAGAVRYCPVCDGYETRGHRVAVLGRELHGLREALFVSGFDNRVTWLSLGTQDLVARDQLARLRERGVLVADVRPLHIRVLPGEGVEVELVDGRRLCFDVLYPALGLLHASSLATAIGARAAGNGQLEVDLHMQSTVPGLYAAGDVAAGLNQIAVAYGHAAIAATAIHNSLPAP